MYTGTERKVIVIKNTGNSIFESAYFILKDDLQDVKESEMVREANNILKNNLIGGYFYPQDSTQKHQKNYKGNIYFFLGAFFSAVVSLLIFLLVN